MPSRYSSVEAAYADEPTHADLTRGINVTLRKEEEAERAAANRRTEVTRLLVIPPAPAEVQEARKNLLYYQSFGEGLTINLDLPVAPFEVPPSPDEE
jgi:hypothetical protein